MYTSAKKTYLIILVGLLSIPFQLFTNAQDKRLTFNQVYMFGEPRILKQLPRLQGWFDDDHYLLQKRDAITSAIVKVNAKTGEETILLDFNAINPNLDEAELTAEENIAITKDYTGLLFIITTIYFSIPSRKTK